MDLPNVLAAGCALDDMVIWLLFGPGKETEVVVVIEFAGLRIEIRVRPSAR